MRAHSRALNICASPVVLFLAAATFASEERVDPSGQKDQLDEVVVEGRRVAELRAEVIAAEDRMVALYNDLNTEPDLDIECFMKTRTGTRISHRYCQLKLQARAQQQDANEYFDFAHASAAMPTGQSPANPVVGVWLAERAPEFRKNLVRLLQENPELRKLVVEEAAALRRYEAARRLESRNKKPSRE